METRTDPKRASEETTPDFFQDSAKVLRLAGWLGCFCLVYVSYFVISGLNVPFLGLDASDQAVLEYAFQHHFQFGRDIIFTFGPLGFLHTVFSQGCMVGGRVAFAFFWSGIVALSATGMARRMLGWPRYAFLIWFVIVAVSAQSDQLAFFVMTYGTVLLLELDNERLWQVPFYFLSFIILSLIKFTFFVIAVGSLCIITGVRVLEKRVGAGLALAAAASFTFATTWFALGQSVTNIPYWIRECMEFVSGYSAAMCLPPKGSVLSASVLALFFFFWAGALIARGIRLRLGHVAVLVTVALYVFMAWKEGFVRADDHVLIFVFFLPLVSGMYMLPLFWNALPPGSKSKVQRLYGGIIVLCLSASYFQTKHSALRLVNDWPVRVRGNLVMIDDAVQGRARDLYTARTNPALDREPSLDRARAVIGGGTVDVMNFLQWAALANRMKYRPRPIVQGYAAYTPALQNLNEDYFRSSSRPQFILLSQQATDGKLPTLEDSAALNYVFGNFFPIARDGDFLVLRQTDAKVPSYQLVDQESLSFGEKLDLSRWEGKPLFMAVSIQPSVLGRVIGFIWQQTPLYIQIETGTKKTRYRFVPEMGELPFLLSPVLNTNDDVLNLFTETNWQPVDAVLFERPSLWSIGYQSKFNVHLYTSRGWPMSSSKPYFARMLADLQALAFWPKPLWIQNWAPTNDVDFFGVPGMLAHAPCKIALAVPKDATSFSGFFGLLPGAYTGQGQTAGVEFSIDIQDRKGRTGRVFDRFVCPLTKPGDRGKLSFYVPVDGQKDRELILTTGIGATGRNNWDWSVWAQCRFARMGVK